MPLTPIYMIRSLLRSFSPVVCFPVLFHLSVCSFSDSFTSNIITHQSAESSVFLKKTPDYTQKKGCDFCAQLFSLPHFHTPLFSEYIYLMPPIVLHQPVSIGPDSIVPDSIKRRPHTRRHCFTCSDPLSRSSRFGDDHASVNSAVE